MRYGQSWCEILLEPEGGCAKFLRSVVLVVNSLILDRTKLRHLRSHSHSRLYLSNFADSLSLTSGAAYIYNSHPYRWRGASIENQTAKERTNGQHVQEYVFVNKG
jgi:hypothetical protein